MLYFFVIWVEKYSTGWWPPIGGCRSEMDLPRPTLTNFDGLFLQKNRYPYLFLERFFWDVIFTWEVHFPKLRGDFIGVFFQNCGGPPQFPKLWGDFIGVFQNCGGPPTILETTPSGVDAWIFGPFLEGLNPRDSAKFFCGSVMHMKDTFCKNGIKTAILALDDHHRNLNINDRDHLGGQLTRASFT